MTRLAIHKGALPVQNDFMDPQKVAATLGTMPTPIDIEQLNLPFSFACDHSLM